MTPRAHNMTWPVDQFFWAVLEAPGVRAANGLPQGLLTTLQEDLPVPVEEVHAVGAAAGDGKLLVCAARRTALNEAPATVLRLCPDDVPALIEPKISPTSFNLLVGDFEPAPLRNERARRTTILTATAAVIACALAIGLARRAEAWNKAGQVARTATTTLAAAVSPNAGPLAVQIELDRLRKAPHAEVESVTPPDAAAALASLLSLWPKELECQTESVQVGRATMTVSLTVAKDARPFLSALKPPDGWTLDEPQLSTTADGSRLHMTFHRKEAKP